MKDLDQDSITSEDWGTQYSRSSRGNSNGRSCTDFYCLIIFITFLCGWMAIGYYAYWNGAIDRVYAPRDTLGRMCGVDDDVKGLPYLLFFDLGKCFSFATLIFGCNTTQICVEKCPSRTWKASDVREVDEKGWPKLQENLYCTDPHIAKTVNSMEKFKKVIEDGTCADSTFTSTSPFLHFCIPDPEAVKNKGAELLDIAGFESGVKNMTTTDIDNVYKFLNHVKRDFIDCWHLIVFLVISSVVCCIFTILIMGIVTRIFVWSVLWIILIVLIAGTATTFLRYQEISEDSVNSSLETKSFPASVTKVQSNSIYGHIIWLFRQKQTWLTLSICVAILSTIYFLLLVFLRSRIGMAIMLIGEGSKAVNCVKSTLCFPIFTRVLQLGVVIWFVLIYIYVKSFGNEVYKIHNLTNDTDCHCTNYKENDWCVISTFNNTCRRADGGHCLTATCQFVEYRPPKMEMGFLLYNFFGLLWGTYFLSGLNRLVLSMCFATWYWRLDKDGVPFYTLTYSFFNSIRYHLGTIATGSFLIATCGFIRAILEKFKETFKQSNGLTTQCALWSLRGCFWILEKFLIFISNKAYVMCAIMGKGYFGSASEAFGLVTSNIIRVVVLDKVLAFILFIAKIALTIIFAMIAFFTFTHYNPTNPLKYPWVPTTLIAVATWIISSSFFGVYSIAVETMFLSFLKDGEINDGSHKKPYYMSERLECIFSKKNQKHDETN